MTGKIELKHGNGGPNMQRLIKKLTQQFTQPTNVQIDAAPFLETIEGQWLTSTDGFSVDPLIFPGGSIGSLAINGTLNDLAVSGAVPKWLTLNLFLEEGLEIKTLEEIINDFATSAHQSAVNIIAGDTKVLPKGQIPGVLMATTGIGLKNAESLLGLDQIQIGDAIVCSGPLGDHGAAVMLAREDFGFSGELKSCCAPVTKLTQSALSFGGLRFMRDPTRGGLTTVLHDISEHCALTPVINEDQLPIRESVNSLCELLGYNPLTLASEGRVIAVIQTDQANDLVKTWRELPNGEQACVIGNLRDGKDDPIMVTSLGGEKYLPPLLDDPLPRIC